MTAVPLFRRLLACSVAICIAATGLMPRCDAASVTSDASRPCCCGCPGECQCGRACACLTPQPAPAKTNGTEKADPRAKPAEPSVAGMFAAKPPASVSAYGAAHSLTALTRFPSLRTLEVRIQT